jgi:hypothetical protein
MWLFFPSSTNPVHWKRRRAAVSKTGGDPASGSGLLAGSSLSALARSIAKRNVLTTCWRQK